MLKSHYIPLILLSIFVVTPMRAAERPLVKTQLTANYAAFTKAFQNKDIDACAKMMTTDYTAVAPDGGLANRKQVLADLKQRMVMMTGVTWVRTITRLDGSGKTALATVHGDLKGSTLGKDGKPHSIELVATTLDRWWQTSTGWKIQHSHVLKAQLTMDGRSMNPH